MPDDLDHEVIDSPQALFRHLYEAHGLVEALDLDPDTAPLQFWLRRHTELERAATRAAAQDRGAAGQDRLAASPVTGAPAARGPATRSAPGTSPARSPAAERPPTGRHAAGPRFRPFADPLVEALAAALVGRGLDERQVRRGLSTFTGADGRHGEDAVRAAFIAPMLEAIAAHLAGDPPGGTRSPQPPPGPAPSEPAPWERAPREHAPPEHAARAHAAARAEPSSGEAQETWVAQPLAARGQGPEPEVDFMAIADVLQERRRSRRGGRRDATPPRTPSPGSPPTGPTATGATPPSREPDDDYMALANALQRHRDDRPH